LQSFLFFFFKGCILQRGPDHINVPNACEGVWCQMQKLFKQQLRSQTLQLPLFFNCRVCGVVLRQCIFQQWCEDECAYARWRALMWFDACCLNHNADLVSSITL
jgi:hypothetical protein